MLSYIPVGSNFNEVLISYHHIKNNWENIKRENKRRRTTDKEDGHAVHALCNVMNVHCK